LATYDAVLDEARSLPPVAVPAATASPAIQGDPAMFGLPTVIAGAIGLGLTTIGYVPASAGLAAIPIILAATGVGLVVGTTWAAMLGQNVVATLYAVFLGFCLSSVTLQLGLAHDWYRIPPDQVANTMSVYLLCWLGTIAALTLATLRLPVVFSLLLGLVDLALALFVATRTGSTDLQRVAGRAVFAFIAVAICLYFHVMSLAFGGKGLPLGRPLVGGERLAADAHASLSVGSPIGWSKLPCSAAPIAS